jgi:predicted protein tyrosine phosphatase
MEHIRDITFYSSKFPRNSNDILIQQGKKLERKIRINKNNHTVTFNVHDICLINEKNLTYTAAEEESYEQQFDFKRNVCTAVTILITASDRCVATGKQKIPL